MTLSPSAIKSSMVMCVSGAMAWVYRIILFQSSVPRNPDTWFNTSGARNLSTASRSYLPNASSLKRRSLPFVVGAGPAYVHAFAAVLVVRLYHQLFPVLCYERNEINSLPLVSSISLGHFARPGYVLLYGA